MAASRLSRRTIPVEINTLNTFRSQPLRPTLKRNPSSTQQWRNFVASPVRLQQKRHNESFYRRLGAAWRDTRVQWYTIPVGVGIGFLAGTHFYTVTSRERARREEEERALHGEPEGPEEPGRPKRRPRVRPSGPWTVQIMSTLPLKALSRWWGWFNELDIPYYLRVPGFRLYSFIFGVK
jgi:phosphatidylserine decarboxylase